MLPCRTWSVADENLRRPHPAGGARKSLFGDGPAQDNHALFGAVTAKGFRVAHFLGPRCEHRADHGGRCSGSSHPRCRNGSAVWRVGRCVAKRLHPPAYFRKEIPALSFR